MSPPISATQQSLRGAAKIGAFFLLFALISGLLNLAINHGLRSIPTSKFGAFNAMITGRVNSDIVIVGSSRALAHYDPLVIQKVTGFSAFNIGMNALQIDLQLAILKTYLKHNVKPRLVIENLDSFSLETTARGAIYDPGLYIPYLHEEEIYEPLYAIDHAAWKWRYIPLYGYAVDDMRFTWMAGLLGDAGWSGREDYFRGFNPREGSWSDDFREFKADHPNGITYKIEAGGIQALGDMLQICQSRGIRMVLVYSPEYFEMQHMELNRREIFQQFQMLARRFDAPFFDYSPSPICRRQALFENSQHLTADGARVFSFDLAHRLVDARVIPASGVPVVKMK